jgi:hypothetical protein
LPRLLTNPHGLCSAPLPLPPPGPYPEPNESKLTNDTNQNEQQKTKIKAEKYLRFIIREASYIYINMCMLMMGSYWHIQQRTLYKLHNIVGK